METNDKKKPAVTVCLVRHGKAGRGDDDHGRALTDKGKEEALWVGKRLARLDVPIRLICSSPLLRARETAELVSKALGQIMVEELEELAPGADVDRLLGIIDARKDKSPLCLVGHMPDLGELAGYLSWGERGRAMDMATGGIVLAEICGSEDSGSSVKWVASPDDPE